MRIVSIAAGRRQPDWVQAGYREYARRLSGACTLDLVEIALGRRSSSSPAHQAVEQEAERMLRAIPRGARVVALSVAGAPWSTAQLAARMTRCMAGGGPVCLLVGGPDGLSPKVLERAHERWSLSPLTLPHGPWSGRWSPKPCTAPGASARGIPIIAASPPGRLTERGGLV